MTPSSIMAQRIIDNAPADQKPIIAAILSAYKVDELERVDALFDSILSRRFKPFDIIYIDLSIDRSVNPLVIDGAGTLVAGLEATDNNSVCTVSFQEADADTNRRFTVQRGKLLKIPYTKLFIYHAAQSGKYLKLLRATSLPSFFFGLEDYSGDAANSDLVTALGNSVTFATSQASVDGTAGGTTIIAANAGRKRVIITNTDVATTVYIRVTVPTTANGHALLPQTSLILNTTAAIKGITSGAAALVTALEE